jgi:hypothetical protein
MASALRPRSDRPGGIQWARPAIGCCAYCGAGICLDHARHIPLAPAPIGPAYQRRNGKRRFICTTCGVPAGGGGG